MHAKWTVGFLTAILAAGILLVVCALRWERFMSTPANLFAGETETTAPLPVTVADKPAGFRYRIPETLKKESMKGLNVTVEVGTTDATEGYIVEILAVVGEPGRDGKSKTIKVGDRTIFKPLTAGDKTTIHLDLPPDEAWSAKGEITLTWQIQPAVEGRTTPKVDLKITKTEARSKEF
jgi:hypothetical protein